MAWAIIVQSSENIFINGAGLYSWFQNYDETCVNTVDCQQRLINIYNVSNLWFNHIVTIGSVEVVTPAISNQNNDIIYATNVTQALVYPWWTAIAAYLDSIASPAAAAPIKDGWVSFGESYASGIGSGQPYDGQAFCKRGTGSYSAFLNAILSEYYEIMPKFQFLGCSGETASQFLEFTGKTNQYALWEPGTSDMAVISLFGNDAGFGQILKACILGYDKSTPCDQTLENAEIYATTSPKVDELLGDIVGKLFTAAKDAGKSRFIVYWIGYPQFFNVTDTTCDNDYFWIWPAPLPRWYGGEYLVQLFRERMNDISVLLNKKISLAIQNYNGYKPYPVVQFINPDADGLWSGEQFCEPGITEPQPANAQGSVGFFYPNGPDSLPDNYPLPSPKPGAPGSWSLETETINSATDCPSETDNAGNTVYSYFWCDMAITLAGNSTAVEAFSTNMLNNGDDSTTAILNSDGSVTISSSNTKYNKMFHPKSAAQFSIAQLILEQLRYN